MVKEPHRAGGCVIAKSPSYALPYGDYFSPFGEARFLPALNGGVSEDLDERFTISITPPSTPAAQVTHGPA
jgi:hypothetical protein